MHRTCAPSHIPKDLSFRVWSTVQELSVGVEVEVRVVSILSVMLKKKFRWLGPKQLHNGWMKGKIYFLFKICEKSNF